VFLADHVSTRISRVCKFECVGSREERRGLNEAVFRQVNEQIAELGERHGAESLEIICECSNDECVKPLSVSLSEYEAARSEPTTFIVKTGHEEPTVERVLRVGGDHTLVEKVGDAAAAAVATDPR
jgi:hypothetical protein